MKAFGSWISITITIVIIYLVGISIGYAHGGGLSGLGCHNDRAIGNVHCHRGEFAGMTFDNIAELIIATTTEPDWTTATEYPSGYPFTMITAKVVRGPYVCNAVFVKPQSLPPDENWGTFHEFQECRFRIAADEEWIDPPRESQERIESTMIVDGEIVASGRDVFTILQQRGRSAGLQP